MIFLAWAWLKDKFSKKGPAKILPLPVRAFRADEPKATLEGSIDYVLKNEGGYSDDPADSGGATNWGITHIDLRKWRGKRVSKADVKALTKEEAIEIYRAFYWNPLSLGECKDQKIATCILDIGVNRGISIGAKYAQLSANACGFLIAADGKIGPKTLIALNACNRSKFITEYHRLTVAGYEAIIKRKPSQKVFRRGWMRRADRLLTLI